MVGAKKGRGRGRTSQVKSKPSQVKSKFSPITLEPTVSVQPPTPTSINKGKTVKPKHNTSVKSTPTKPKAFKDAPDFPFEDLDPDFPSSSSSRLPPLSSPSRSKINRTAISKTASDSSAEAVSSQIPGASPQPKRRGRPAAKLKKRKRSDTSDSESTDLSQTEDSIAIHEHDSKKPRNSDSSVVTLLPRSSRSLSPSRFLRQPSMEYIEHSHEEFLELCKSSPAPVIVDEEVKEEVFRPSRMPEDVRKDDSIYVLEKKCWWPARIISFNPAKNLQDQKKGRDYFTVETISGNILERVRRNQIITESDEGIASCALGGLITTTKVYTSDANERGPTPEPQPTSTEPLTPEQFGTLDRRQQLNLIRPHLQSILSEKYPPAQWRLDKFFAGGKERFGLNHEVAYGDIEENEVEGVFIPELRRWVLRADGRNDKQRRPGEPPRPTGSERYDKLSPRELTEFIENVLLPETVIQLCIRSIGADELLSLGNDDDDDGGEDDLGIEDDDDFDDSNPDMSPNKDPPISTPIMEESTAKSNSSTTINSSTDTNSTANIDADLEDRDTLIYVKAREYLLKLNKWNLYKDFEGRCATLNRARRVMREKLGLPAEDFDDLDTKNWKLSTGEYDVGWAGGRVRKIRRMEESH